MGNTDQTIRISARGEFGQLQRGLKSLQGDLRDVANEVNRGARRGGVFDESQLRALDIFRRRFKDSLEDINKEFDKQNRVIDDLYKKMEKANVLEKKDIQDKIRLKEKELDIMRRQILEVEKLYNTKSKEANSFGSSASMGGSGGSSGSGLLGNLASKFMGAGKFALGLAGIGSMASEIAKAYQLAYQRSVGSLDLSQRLRGHGFSGSAVGMYDQASAIGRSRGMGYTAQESWQLLDAYSQRGGAINGGGQSALQLLARGYGLDTSQVGATAGGVKQLGGVTSPKQFADLIAGSVSASGMTPRILEVMEAHTGLLQQLNTSFKDGTSKNIMALQTTLDTIGLAKGMTRLTGQQGANIIGGLGGIYTPQNDKWKWIGIEALQRYNPKKYGSMDLFNTEMSFEDGLMNPDNLPAMVKYIKNFSGGNKQLEKRVLQNWLTDGGFVASKREASELYDATGGLTDLTKLKSKLGNSGAKFGERQGQEGQKILDIEARYEKALERIGQPLLTGVTELKKDVVTAVEALGGNKTLNDIYDQLNRSSLNMIELLMTVGLIGKGVSTVFKVFRRVFGEEGKGGKGRNTRDTEEGSSKSSRAVEEEVRAKGKSSSEVSRRLSEAGKKASERVKGGKGGKGFGSGLGEGLGLLGAELGGEYLFDPLMDFIFGHDKGDVTRSSKRSMSGRDLVKYKGKDGKYRYKVEDTREHYTDSRDPVWKRTANDYNKHVETELVDFSKKGTLQVTSLSSSGKQNLQSLSSEGLLKLGSFQKDGTVRITQLTSEGSKMLRALYNSGQISYTDFTKSSKGFFEDIKKIFTDGFKSIQSALAGATAGTPLDIFAPTAPPVKSPLSTVMSGKSFFTGWQSRVTGKFLEQRPTHKHKGLDIDGKQGDQLDALTGGVLSFIKMDDGGMFDPDHRANSTGGGTELGVRMADGRVYTYSHLSKINPALMQQYIKSGKNKVQVNTGDYLANVGGLKGVAGSGSSTSGDHLHLGYLDKNGGYLDPKALLNSLSKGDSDTDFAQLMGLGSGSGAIATESTVNINLNITGDGVGQLNMATLTTLETLVRKVVEETKLQSLLVNPVKAGWN